MCGRGTFHVSSLECHYINWNKKNPQAFTFDRNESLGKEKLVYLSHLHFPFPIYISLNSYCSDSYYLVVLAMGKKKNPGICLREVIMCLFFLTAKVKTFFFLVVSTWKVSPRSEYLVTHIWVWDWNQRDLSKL